MPSTLIKIVSIGGGLATATGAGIGIAYLTSDSPQKVERLDVTSKEELAEPKEITKHLENLGLEIPAKEADKERWNTQWGKFKEKYKSNNSLADPWKIDAWTNLRSQKDAPDKFKEKCIENGKKKVSKTDESIFTEVKDYCSVEKIKQET